MPPTCPLWLVAGFLGAGKTTLLRRLVRTAQGRKLVFVVNEFSAVDVDAGLIERDGGTTVAVPGGSIFCRCLVSEFVSVLNRIAEGALPRIPDPSFRAEGVVIEASGMADPRAMRRLLAESRLDARFHVAGITAVVDPGSLMKLLLVLPMIRGQIEAADLILLNKTDLHAPAVINRVRSRIREINPHATVIRCIRGGVDPALILAEGESARIARLDADFGLCRDPHFERETATFDAPVALPALRERLAAAGDALYRAKGFVRAEGEGWVYLDWSMGARIMEPAEPRPASSLAVIWNPLLLKESPLAALARPQA